VEYLRFDQHNIRDFEEKAALVNIPDFDGLLFAPVFSNIATAFIGKWKEAGKPCVLFNSKVEGVEVNSFIGQDAFQSAYLGGKLMNYGLAAQQDLIIVNLSMRKDNYQHIIKREKGFRSFFEEHTNRINNLVTIDINGGEHDKLASELDSKIKKMNVAGIFVTNSRVHLVARYLAERGFMNIRLIGYDLLNENVEYLRREYIDFLISQSPEEQSYLGLKFLFNLVVLKRQISNEILLPIDILTKENIDHYLQITKQYES